MTSTSSPPRRRGVRSRRSANDVDRHGSCGESARRWLVATALVSAWPAAGASIALDRTATQPGMSLAAAWPMHQIVPGVAGRGKPDGADGVDIADIDGDGQPDIVSGHEQGWKISVSLNPGPA